MEQITKKIVSFGTCGAGRLYKTYYGYEAYYGGGNIAIFAGKEGQIGKLSVNLMEYTLKENEFFVKLYGTGVIMNKPCLDTELFEILSEPFKIEFGTFQKWCLKKS